MANYTPLDIQAKVKADFEKAIAENVTGKSLKSIRRDLAISYDLAESTIFKITTSGYKLKEVVNAQKPEVAVPAVPDQTLQNKYKVRFDKNTYPKTMMFIGWEIRTSVTKEILNLIDQMQREYNAEVYVTPLWLPDLEFLPPSLNKYNILIEDLDINNNLKFKYVPTHALSLSPLQGWSGAHDKSVIFPGLVKEMQSEKTTKLCKQIMTTGSIGKLNAYITQYKHVTDEESRTKLIRRWGIVQNRRGGRTYEIAKEFTIPSILIVDVKDKNTFFPRYVTMKNFGTIYDKNLKFTAFKEKPEISRPELYMVADMHHWFVDHEKMNATYQMIEEWKPKAAALNDFLDMASINHHEMHDFAKVVSFPSLEEEAEQGYAYLQDFCSRVDNVYYLNSNHDNFLPKYLSNEKNYKIGMNYRKAIELRHWQLLNPDKHPIQGLLKMDTIKNLRFISEKENLEIKGTIVKHGHEGISGARVGFRALQKVYNHYIMGHSHSPQVFRNGAMVGTSSKLDLSYNIGADAWMHCDGLIQPDGTIQLIPIIYGEYRI